MCFLCWRSTRFFRSSVSLLNPSAVFIYLITVRSCGRSIQFSHGTVRNGVKIIPVVFDLLPSGFHAGIDINEKPAVLLMVKEKPDFVYPSAPKAYQAPLIISHAGCSYTVPFSAVLWSLRQMFHLHTEASTEMDCRIPESNDYCLFRFRL